MAVITDAQILSVVFYNSLNSYAVLRLCQKGGGEFIATGICPDLEAFSTPERAKGLICNVKGKWVKHPKYGNQIEIESIKIDDPGLFFFLTNIVSGIGSNLATVLIKKYGEVQLINILDNNPEELIKVKGIKEKKLAKIMESWNKYKSLRELNNFFKNNNVKITSALLLRIYNHFKNSNEDMIEAINKNPYILTEIRGIGFKTADKIALQMGIDFYSEFRIKSLIDHILLSEASDNGHTFLPKSELFKLSLEYITDEAADIEKFSDVANNILNNSNDYYVDKDSVALKGYKIMEDYIEKNILERLSKKSSYVIKEDKAIEYIKKLEELMKFSFGKKQREALMSITTGGHNVFILCGYAGTGKTTISKVILDFYSFFVGKENIVTCAFTGMASKRISELTGFKGNTIHSLLGYNKDGKFKHNINNPLPYKVILIDEASMINLSIFYSLMRAIKEDAVIIMVGDDAQLPPIGEGNVFSDLLQHDSIPKVKLDRIYRQSEDSVITHFASFIRQGIVPENVYSKYKDFEFIIKDIANYWTLKKTLSEKELQEKRQELHERIKKELLNSIKYHIQKENLDRNRRIWDIQVITPMKVTVLGTAELNTILQETLNYDSPKTINIRGYALKEGDKLIHLKNQDMFALDIQTYNNMIKKTKDLDIDKIRRYCIDKKLMTRIYNGNLGIVLHIDEDNEFFSVMYVGIEENPIIVIYDFDDYKDIIDLGYALTIHKTQGNQFKYVFIPLTNSFFVMLNNKLMYTSITRAIKKVVLIGQPYSFKKGCTNINSAMRYTFLRINRPTFL